MSYHKRMRIISKEKFFSQNMSTQSAERLSEEIYIIIHTVYLRDSEDCKAEFFKIWKEKLNFSITDESYDYLRENSPVLMRPSIIDAIKHAKGITSSKYLKRAIVSLEFDLWLIEQLKSGGNFQIKLLKDYFSKKYGDFIHSSFRDLAAYDLAYSRNLRYIAQNLEPYYDQIKTVFIKLFEVNKEALEAAAESAKLPDSPEVKTQEPPKTQRPQESIEYELILGEQNERITKLESDIREFKRQRDELREYSVKQYDKGVVDLFSSMNDERYGKIIDYFYSLLKNDSTDETLVSYLENLFMLLENMEIEPIIPKQNNIEVDESRLTKDYNLDFDKQYFVKGRESVKYVGWKYKDLIIEKPTLKIKGE